MAADPPDNMETCPSPEIGDTRKRPLDSDSENSATKRSHFSNGKYIKSAKFIFHENPSFRAFTM